MFKDIHNSHSVIRLLPWLQAGISPGIVFYFINHQPSGTNWHRTNVFSILEAEIEFSSGGMQVESIHVSNQFHGGINSF
jgi:hypothetical protein